MLNKNMQKLALMDNISTFADWLVLEMGERDWSQSDLARAASVTPTAISDIIKRRREPGPSLCQGIAAAFELPLEIVYRKAGLLPPKPEVDEQIDEILHEAAQLTPAEREELLAFIRMKRNLRKKNPTGG